LKRYILIVIALTFTLAAAVAPASAQTDNETVVRAVLFFSPTCPHCHTVINELIIPMIDEYGDQLQVLGVDVTQEQGQALYQLAIEHYQIPANRLGVPTLIVQDTVLVGSGEIPDQFPDIVTAGLAAGGVEWPGIPGLDEALAAKPEQAAEPAETGNTNAGDTVGTTNAAGEAAAVEAEAKAPEPAEAAPESAQEVIAELEQQAATADSSVAAISEGSLPEIEAESAPPADPIGISLAGLVLGGMLFAFFYTGRSISTNKKQLF
jgi:thiol-disulfide isomerase/thioredoxin